MFTGIIEEAGVVEGIKPAAKSIQLTLLARGLARGLKPGASVAVNGCCLTVVKIAARGITIFLTSHILSVAERIANQFVMIRSGKMVWNSTVEELPKSLEDLYFDLVESPAMEDVEWLGS